MNPPWIGDSWKFEVVDIAKVDGKECFVVNVVEYPDEKITYGVLYFQRENLVLYPVQEDGFTRKFASDNAVPVVDTNWVALYDFPAFPLERNATRAYNFRGTKIQQSVSADTFTTKDGKTSNCFKVSLQYGGINVTQYWRNDAPWWVYEEKDGMVKAWLEDWGHEELLKKLQ